MKQYTLEDIADEQRSIEFHRNRKEYENSAEWKAGEKERFRECCLSAWRKALINHLTEEGRSQEEIQSAVNDEMQIRDFIGQVVLSNAILFSTSDSPVSQLSA